MLQADLIIAHIKNLKHFWKEYEDLIDFCRYVQAVAGGLVESFFGSDFY